MCVSEKKTPPALRVGIVNKPNGHFGKNVYFY